MKPDILQKTKKHTRRLLPRPPDLPTRIPPPTTKDALRNPHLSPKQYVTAHKPHNTHISTYIPKLYTDTITVYPNGDVCISILHPPEEDKWGYESAAERWSPVQTPETILLSVISMLSSPNDESPANPDAARLWRENTAEFKKHVRKCVRDSLEFE